MTGDRMDEAHTTRFAAVSGQDEPETPRDGTSERGAGEGNEPASSDGSSGGGGEKSGKRKVGSFLLEMVILIAIALVLVFLIQTFLARVYVIPSGSMEKTLHGCPGCTGDRIIADKVIYDFRDPRPGDVVVFKGPDGWEQTEFTVQESSNVFVHWLRQFGAALGVAKPDEYDLVKRVIAVGGQTVSCCDSRNRVMVDGKPLDEPYLYYQPGVPNQAVPNGPENYPGVNEPGRQAYFSPVTVPKGDIFVMGDNRNNSADSRYQNGGGVAGMVPIDNVIGKARTIIWPPSRWAGVSDYNPQQHAHALGAPPWLQGIPTGVAVAMVWPRLRSRRRLSRAVEERDRERERRRARGSPPGDSGRREAGRTGRSRSR